MNSLLGYVSILTYIRFLRHLFSLSSDDDNTTDHFPHPVSQDKGFAGRFAHKSEPDLALALLILVHICEFQCVSDRFRLGTRSPSPEIKSHAFNVSREDTVSGWSEPSTRSRN